MLDMERKLHIEAITVKRNNFGELKTNILITSTHC